ncbi:MAG: hypothetical protein QOE59_4098 [Actinomycetota bacterium]|nr:hypothetical protein [Actinomycetota bacterium]
MVTIQDAGGPGPAAARRPEPADRLDRLVPGLADAVVDLLDAVYDHVDEVGPGRAVLLARLSERLGPRWDTASSDDRLLTVLDALRVVIGTR